MFLVKISLLLVSYLFAVIQSKIDDVELLHETDLSADNSMLIYLYLERKNYRCGYCAMFNNLISTLNSKNILKIRKINIYENPFLGSRFFTFSYPTIIWYSHRRCHIIDLDLFEKIIVDDKISSSHFENSIDHKRCRRFYNNPISCTMMMFGVLGFIFFNILYSFYDIFDKTPPWLFSIFFGIIISIMLIILIKVLSLKYEPDINDLEEDGKEKVE